MNTLFRNISLIGLLVVSPIAGQSQEKSAAPETHFILHKVPECPLVIDGKPMPTTEIVKYNGMPLCYVVDPVAQRNGQEILRVFTSDEKAKAYIDSIKPLIKTDNAHKLCFLFAPGLTLHEDINYGGHEITFSGALNIRNLRDFYAYTKWVPWPVNVSWNDLASSFENEQGIWSVCYENINYGGNRFYLAPYQSIPWIGSYWNDRVSSLAFLR